METLVLTVISDDRPGLVATLSASLAARGATWQRSQLSQLAGKFAGIVKVEIAAERAEALRDALAERTSASSEAPTHHLTLDLVGADRPGIVAEVSALLSARGIGIVELETFVSEAPMAGGMLFEAHAVLAAPAGADEGELRAAMESLADELMVDVALAEDA